MGCFPFFSSPSPQLTIHLLNRKLKERWWGWHKKYEQLEPRSLRTSGRKYWRHLQICLFGPAHPPPPDPLSFPTVHGSTRTVHGIDSNRHGPTLLAWSLSHGWVRHLSLFEYLAIVLVSSLVTCPKQHPWVASILQMDPSPTEFVFF